MVLRMDSRINTTTTSAAAAVAQSPAAGAEDLRTEPLSRQQSYDVNNDQNPSPLDDYHLPTPPRVRPKSLGLRTTTAESDFNCGESGHVSAMSDLVVERPLSESEVAGAAPKSLLVKSNTCCNFYCTCDGVEAHSKPIPIKRLTDRVQQRKKLFPSFSHPDTSYIFTEDELKSPQAAVAASPTNSRRSNWRRRDLDCELTWPFSSRDAWPRDKKRFSVLRSSCSEDHDGHVVGSPTGHANNERYTIIPVHPEISIKLRSEPETGSVNRNNLKIDKTSESTSAKDDKQEIPNNGPKDDSEVLIAAQKFFQESGILGPAVAMGNTLFRKSSKVHIIDNLQFEQVKE